MNNVTKIVKKITLSDQDIEVAKDTLRESKMGTDRKTLRRVLGDLAVVKMLEKNGDQLHVSRPIEHFVYIPTKGNIAQFHKWVLAQGYTVIGLNRAKDSKVCISFEHIGCANLSAVISHTIPINRASRRAGGQYDGWGTFLEFETEDGFDNCPLVTEQQGAKQS
ncbi:ribonuclease E inhibitor RraB [Duganella dendranthematis]|uniref:Ribonuclease E inhibitor RraB n=1 Tax=Duganella dendranthematis TaxID=2728021 RepID=A0ABX6MA99_9BURK|nr:ribonuclease E inhibitor RraB [Duganella dendranthematis]QJD91251.1 ribonuclease E inhibitor RraB [Duganella dendranthematis]